MRAQTTAGVTPAGRRHLRDPTTDPRRSAVLAVLAGDEPAHVADHYGIDLPLLERYIDAFLEGGQAALTGGTDRHTAESLDRHLGLVAHELGSPLALIRGWTELLRLTPDLEPALREQALSGMLAQIDRLSRLAQDTLDAASVSMGRLRLERSRVDVRALVAAVLEARPGSGRDITPVTDEQGELICLVDTDRFGQVLDNLLDNATRYAPGAITVTVASRGHFAQITVSSDGPPIPAEIGHRLFEPFERASASAGTGLGLYVCRSLVAAHGGQIGLRVDDGNHFWFRLPLARGTLTGAREAASERDPAPR